MSITTVDEVEVSSDLLIADFQEKFQALIPSLRAFQENLGVLLEEAREAMSFGQFGIFRTWIKDKYQVSKAAQDVSMQIARGDVDPRVAERVPASILKDVPTGKVPQWDQTYEIYSPDVGGPITKKFSDFSDNEIKHVANSKTGVTTIADMSKPELSKGYRTAVARNFRIDGDFLILMINSMNLEVKIKITDSLREAVG